MDEPFELLDDVTPAEITTTVAPPDENGVLSLDEDAETNTETTKPAAEAPAAAAGEAKPEGDKPAAEAEPEAKPEAKEGEEEPTDETPAKKLSGAQRSARRIAALEAQIASLQTSRPTVASGEKPSAEAIEKLIGPAPKEDEFKDFLEFSNAQVAYEVEKRQAAREIERNSASDKLAAEARVAEMRDAHGDRIEALEKILPGSSDKIKAANDLPVAPHVAHFMLESDKSAELALHFAQKPDLLTRLNGMNPLQAAREFGRLESTISAPKPRTETQASAPVVPLKGTSAQPSADAELKAWMAKNYG